MAVIEDFAVHFLTAILSLAILVLYLHGRSKKAPTEKHKLPPGSMGWPLIGENIQFLLSTMSDHFPRSFINSRQLRYGDIFSSNLFGRRVIISVNPEFNRFVLQNEGRLFQTSNTQGFIDITGKYGLLALRGDLQRKIHGITVNLLNHENLRSHLMDNIENLLINAMSEWDGKKIKLQDECHQIILNLMAKQLLDLSPSKETEEIARQFDNFSAAVVCLPLRIPGSTFYRGLQARKYLLNKIYEIMGERRKHPEVVHNDLLSKFLKEDPPLPDEFVVDTLLFLLFAGHETVSRSMAMSIKFLTDCPQALKQLQDEHDQILKSNGNKKLSWDSYKSMKFTQNVINEVLRMANVAPFLFREATQDIDTKGYQIPKGQTILVFMSGVHTDENNYAAAFEFNPWRWESCDNGVSNNPLFAPFGGGGRLCPGYNLARLELSLFLHHFVTKFRWKVHVNDKISNLPFPHMVKGLPLQLYSRD
ncbi:hypothetical protein SUGI_0473780 [Cryptomeria japonica]|nr:hypothetical protein SUGI_0473780 [Cryptomeria japonica]